MTLHKSAWAIDGAMLNSGLARRASFAGTNGTEGIVKKGDLKVTQLSTPGVGLLVAGGSGLVLNRYQTSPSETYVVWNEGTHTIPSGSMPASNPSTKHYIVAAVIGDPEFSQSGHPWMSAGDPPVGEEETFEYVRFTLIEVSSGATTLSGNYPALPLARLDIPANTTTITNAMIVDLRKLAQPRQEQQIFTSAAGAFTNETPRYAPLGTTYGDWGAADYAPSTKVPSWATRAIVVAHANSVIVGDKSLNVTGRVRAQLGSVSGAPTIFNLDQGGTGAERFTLMTAGEYDVSGIAGTTVALRFEAYQNAPASPTDAQRLALKYSAQQIFDVRYFEE